MKTVNNRPEKAESDAGRSPKKAVYRAQAGLGDVSNRHVKMCPRGNA